MSQGSGHQPALEKITERFLQGPDDRDPVLVNCLGFPGGGLVGLPDPRLKNKSRLDQALCILLVFRKIRQRQEMTKLLQP